MNSGQEAVMIVGGIIGLMLLFMLSALPTVFIVAFFDIPETYLGPTLLGCMVGWVLFFMNCMRKEKIGFAKEAEQRHIESKKRNLIYLSKYFQGSRKSIAENEYFEKLREKNRIDSKGKCGKQLRKKKYTTSDELM